MTTNATPSNEPIVSLQYEQEDDATFTVSATVRGLTSAAQAEAAMNHMQMLLCAAEVEQLQ